MVLTPRKSKREIEKIKKLSFYLLLISLFFSLSFGDHLVKPIVKPCWLLTIADLGYKRRQPTGRLNPDKGLRKTRVKSRKEKKVG